MDQTKKSTNEEAAKCNIDTMNKYNQELLLSYIFEHRVKGIDNPIPLFRVSPTLADENKEGIKRVINLLANNRTGLLDNLTEFMERREYESCSF